MTDVIMRRSDLDFLGALTATEPQVPVILRDVLSALNDANDILVDRKMIAPTRDILDQKL